MIRLSFLDWPWIFYFTNYTSWCTTNSEYAKCHNNSGWCTNPNCSEVNILAVPSHSHHNSDLIFWCKISHETSSWKYLTKIAHRNISQKYFMKIYHKILTSHGSILFFSFRRLLDNWEEPGLWPNFLTKISYVNISWKISQKYLMKI